MPASRPRWNLLDRIDSAADSYLARTTDAARGLPITLYLLLGALALLQILNPGALERIALQPAGRWLLGAVSVLLFVSALLAIGGVLLRRPQALLAPGASDALLHCSVAVVGLRLSFGAGLLPETAGNAIIGGLGVLDAIVGSYLVLAAGIASDADAVHEHRLHALVSYDHRVRGAVLAALGLLLFAGGAQRTAELGMASSLGRLQLPALAIAAAALTAYAVHGLWSMRQEGHIALL